MKPLCRRQSHALFTQWGHAQDNPYGKRVARRALRRMLLRRLRRDAE